MSAPRVVFPGLDTVRAMGALAVLTTHVAFWTGSYSFTLVGTALSRLDVGVAIFFVLSGFLLSRPRLAAAATNRAQPDFRGYLGKRALRIMPVYWVVVVLAMLIVPENRDAGFGEWVGALTLTNIYFAQHLPAGLTQMWSLATEVAFYVALPLIVRAWLAVTRARRADGPVLLLLGASGLISAGWLLYSPGWLGGAAPLHFQWLPTYLVWFCAGIALAHVHVHIDTSEVTHRPVDLVRILHRLGDQPGVCWSLAGAAFLVACTPLAGPSLLVPSDPKHVATKTLLYAVIAGCIVLASAFGSPTGLYARTVAHPFARHLGRTSYPVFCIHVLVLHLFALTGLWEPFTGKAWPIFGLTLLVSWVLAEILHFAVEAPAMRLRPGKKEYGTLVAASNPSEEVANH